MAIHAPHEDSHTHGLADGCERCQEHTERPWASLDETNIRRLVRGEIYTRNDAIAAGRLETALEIGRYLIKLLEREEVPR